MDAWVAEWHLARASSSVICDESARIDASCENCGPDWGDLQQCKDLCSAAVGRRRRSAHTEPACQYITFFSDDGCRMYTACDSTEDNTNPAVTTTIYGVGPASGPFFFSSVPLLCPAGRLAGWPGRLAGLNSLISTLLRPPLNVPVVPVCSG